MNKSDFVYAIVRLIGVVFSLMCCPGDSQPVRQSDPGLGYLGRESGDGTPGAPHYNTGGQDW